MGIGQIAPLIEAASLHWCCPLSEASLMAHLELRNAWAKRGISARFVGDVTARQQLILNNRTSHQDQDLNRSIVDINTGRTI